MIILDSSFLIALLHEKDSLHDKAVEDMRKYEEQKEEFFINEHVLGETATVLLYQAGLERSKIFLDYAVENFQVQSCDHEDLKPTLKVFQNQKHELSYVDASIVYLARFLRCPIATYDKNIIKELA